MAYEDQQWSSDEQNDNRNKRKFDGDDDQSYKKQRSDGFEVIVKNLDFNVNEDSLTSFFESCGAIEEVKIPRKPTGESRGYGFVKFDSQEAVDAAINMTNEEFEGRQITVALSSKSGGGNDREEKNNIFVGNLSYDTTEDGLADLFGSCGNITAVRMPTDEHTGRKKGFAFVDFDSAEAVEKALEMNETELDGRNIRVDKGGQKKQGGGFRGGRGGRGGGFRGGRGGRGGGFGGDRGGRGGGFGGGRGRGGGFRGGRGGGFRGGFGGGDFQGKRKTF